jgi:hypothetical protein
MNDEHIVRLLRASAPPVKPADEALTMRQHALMERIMTEPPRPRRRRLAALIGVPIAAFVSVLAVIFAVVQPFGTSVAVAYGPAPLVYTATGETVEDVVREASALLARTQGATEGGVAQRRAVYSSWDLTVNEDGRGVRTAFVSPSETQLTWAEDLSGSLLVVAGEPYAADGTSGEAQSDEAPKPGTVLDDRTFAPGEYPVFLPDGGTMGAAEIATLMSDYAGEDGRGGDAMRAIESLLTEWTLTDAQHAAMLQSLLTYDDLEVLGSTTDRLGRPVVGIAAPGRGDQTATLLVSAESGRIVGIERSVLNDDEDLMVPAGTVVSYILWEDSE